MSKISFLLSSIILKSQKIDSFYLVNIHTQKKQRIDLNQSILVVHNFLLHRKTKQKI